MAGVEAERAHAAKVQDALYRIAELASAAHDMREFYAAVHEVVSELMELIPASRSYRRRSPEVSCGGAAEHAIDGPIASILTDPAPGASGKRTWRRVG